MAKAPAIVLSSGGLHSLICAGVAAREYRIALLHVKDYRPTHVQALAAFEKQVGHLKPLKSWIVEAPFIRQTALPPETTGVVTSTSSDPQAGLIPLRELHLLSMAVGFARQLRAGTIFWGIQHEPRAADAMARHIELVQIYNQMLEVMGGEPALTVRTPLLGLEDFQAIELGYQMSLPYSASWTCQMPGETPCMSCPACSRRIRAFRAAQLADPLVRK
jgi:7-cyano-7-deazaguanine synthase